MTVIPVYQNLYVVFNHLLTKCFVNDHFCQCMHIFVSTRPKLTVHAQS